MKKTDIFLKNAKKESHLQLKKIAKEHNTSMVKMFDMLMEIIKQDGIKFQIEVKTK
jgi:hypothetical protein